jgi:hypothetical protein
MPIPKFLTRTKTHVRCGSPYCDWGTPLPGFSESEWDRCRHEIPEHCIERQWARFQRYRTGRLARPGGAHADVAGLTTAAGRSAITLTR